jgi:predicted transcriptional regulator
MAGIKQQMISFIERLPDDATWDDVMAELYFRIKVDSGLKDLDDGKGISHEDVKERMSKWLSKE